MKKLLFSCLLLVSTACYAQKDTSATLVLNKTEQLVDKYSGKIADAFIATMETAKPVAKEGFAAVVWLQVAKGIAYCIPFLMFLVFMFCTLTEYNRIDNLLKSEKVPANMRATYDVTSEENITFKFIIYCIITLLLGIGSCFSIFDGITHLLAPKWFAIKEIIELFK